MKILLRCDYASVALRVHGYMYVNFERVKSIAVRMYDQGTSTELFFVSATIRVVLTKISNRSGRGSVETVFSIAICR